VQIRLKTLIVITALACASIAHAWGGVGHIAITELALDGAAGGMPNWINNALFHQRVAFMCNEPDRRRGAGLVALDHENSPEHYIDIDQLPDFGLTFEGLPRLRYDYVLAMGVAMERDPERLARDPDDVAGVYWSPGFLPYAMMEDYTKLVSVYRVCRVLETLAPDDPQRALELEQARAEAAYHMGLLSHWVGDGAQPLHTTIHHHGWIGENPEGYTTERAFHSYIDDHVVDHHGLRARALVGTVRIEPIAVADASDPWPEVCAHIGRAFALVEPLYRLERDDRLEQDEGRDFILDRFRDGAGTLAGLYLAAWRQSEIDAEDVARYLRYEAPSLMEQTEQ